MRFKYNARNEAGELQAGFVDAVGKEAALDILKSHSLFLLSLESAEHGHWYDKAVAFIGRAKIKDIMLFTRQFSILLESKVPLSDSLKALERQIRKPILKEAIRDVYESVAAGLSLSQAFERQGNTFSEFYVNMIRPAEVTGRLEQAMGFLADYLEKESIWISRLRNALIYPIIVIVLFFIVAIVMLVVVFPQLEPIFAESRVPLPFITIVFLAIGGFILKWWLAIILVFGLLIIMVIDYLRSREGKLVLDEMIIRLPFVRELFKKIYVARFAESVSLLIRGGIPLTQGLEITGHAMENIVYREILHEIAEGIKRGDMLSALLRANEQYFPPLVSEMVATGEGAGRLDEVLSKIASLYTREVDDVLSNLVELVQPALIIFIGAFVGVLFASILIPIYNLAQAY